MSNIRRVYKQIKEKRRFVLKAQADLLEKTRPYRKKVGTWLNEQGIESAEDLNEFIEILSIVIYEEAKIIAKNNSKYGWTLASSMTLEVYIDEKLTGGSKEELDTYFYKHYSEDDWDEYKDLKSDIRENINPKWNELIDGCFILFEKGRYKIAIPTLLSIIEGEIAATLNTQKYGGPLKGHLRKSIKNEKDSFKKLGLYSVYTCIMYEGLGIFIQDIFNEERKEVLNRNRVLHGRDDPRLWEEVDVLRLLTVLNSIQYVQQVIKDNEKKTSTK